MEIAIRKTIGIFLAIIGAVCFIVFMWIGVRRWVDYGFIAASIASLFPVFVGGFLSSSFGRKVGCRVTTFGLIGTPFLGLFTYLAKSSVKNLGVDYAGGIFLFYICGTLAGISIAVMVFGLGILSGMLIIPRKGRGDDDTTLHISPDEPAEQ